MQRFPQKLAKSIYPQLFLRRHLHETEGTPWSLARIAATVSASTITSPPVPSYSDLDAKHPISPALRPPPLPHASRVTRASPPPEIALSAYWSTIIVPRLMKPKKNLQKSCELNVTFSARKCGFWCLEVGGPMARWLTGDARLARSTGAPAN